MTSMHAATLYIGLFCLLMLALKLNPPCSMAVQARLTDRVRRPSLNRPRSSFAARSSSAARGRLCAVFVVNRVKNAYE